MKIQRFGALMGAFLMFFMATALGPFSLNVVQAQKGAPPAPANPQAPVLSPLMPSAVQPGAALELTLTGSNLANPTGLSLGFSAKTTIPTENKNGKDPAKLKVRIDVPKNTPQGWYPLRLGTVAGISNLRLLCVDDLPQLTSTGANRSRDKAQVLAVPCAVSGAIAAGQGDFFRISVKAGQRLSFDCLARRLGAAIDAEMHIYDGKSQRELAYDNDSPGCQTDPRISYTFKEGGDYLIEVKDVQNQGGPEAFYRLRVGDFPLATTAVPMAAKRGTKAKIAFAGPAVDGVKAVDVDVPGDPTITVVWVSPKGPSGLTGWPVPLALSDHEEAVEQEPNDVPTKANRIAVPGGITGRFQHSDDTDYYLFSAKKGEKLAIEAQTLELYSPSLVLMVIKNAKSGAEAAKSNPQAPLPNDQRIDFTAPDDADYLVEVQHLYFAGGPSESYHVTVRPQVPSFDLVLASERFELPVGGSAAIPLQVVRKGYTGPIEVTAVGAPALHGTATIKAGQNAGLLMVAAKSDTPMGPYQMTVLAKATVDGKMVVRPASANRQIVLALNGLPYPPLHLTTNIALAVKEKPPFSLAVKMNPPEGIPGGKVSVTVSVQRDAGFTGDIALNPPTGLPATIPAPKTVGPIAKDKTEFSFPLDLSVKTPQGEYFVFITGKAKYQGKDVAAAAPPLLLSLGLPFDLKAEPSDLALKPGEKKKLKITALRKGGYKGPITLDIRKLPPGVTASKATIAADQTTAEVDLAADAKAAPVVKTDVDASGTATAANNLQNVSPAVTIRVEKK